jgi:ADP-heptose:LPS heptosyltransferase
MTSACPYPCMQPVSTNKFMEYKPAHSLSRRIQAALAFTLYGWINVLLKSVALMLWPRRRPQDAERIAIFRIGHIGDITCALPAIYAVRRAYPSAHLTLITSTGRVNSPGARELLEGVSWIDEIMSYSAEDIATLRNRWCLAQKLRRRRFDIWISLSPNLTSVWRELRDLMFVRVVGPRWARGWSVSTLGIAAQAQSEHMVFPDEVEKNLALIAGLGIKTDLVEFGLPQSESVKLRVESLLPHIPDQFWVAIAPGAKRSTNRWPAERFVEVGKHLAARGIRTVLLGGQNDAQECEHIAASIGQDAISLAGQLTLSESCELLRHCRFAICVDSGVQHLASAVGTPCISLFSFWQMRGKWWPHGKGNVVIQKWVPCHTCLLNECPHDNLCMQLIEVKDITPHLDKILGPYKPPKNTDNVITL